MRAIAAAGIAAAAALALGAASARPAAEAGPEVMDRFLFSATLEGLRDDAMPDEAVTAVLERDFKGRYRNFIYGCPVCQPVLEGFRAYALRRQYQFARKGGDPAPSPEIAGIVQRLESPDATVRGAAVNEYVKRVTERHMERARLREDERTNMRIRLEEGRKRGMELLRATEGFALKSCPSCDGASGELWQEK